MAGALCAQQGYSPTDIQTGKQLYGVNCTHCHGPTGGSVAGVDLGHGTFRRASTDNELVAIMVQGIIGTPMPPANLSDQQAHQIVAYLRSMAAATDTVGANKTNLAHGKALFREPRLPELSSRKGPWLPRRALDLTNIGARRKRDEITHSIVDPNAEVLPENRYVEVVTRDGATLTGRVLNEDTFSLQLIDSKEKLVSLQKADLSKLEFLKTSAMPSYRDKLSGDELSDLTGYLLSLKGL